MVPNEQQMGNESTKRSAPLACRTRVTTDSPGGRRSAGAVPGLGEGLFLNELSIHAILPARPPYVVSVVS